MIELDLQVHRKLELHPRSSSPFPHRRCFFNENQQLIEWNADHVVVRFCVPPLMPLMSAAPQLSRTPAFENGTLRTAGMGRLRIGYALVDNCSLEEARAAIIDYAVANHKPAYVITPNAQHIVLLNKNERLRQIYRSADLVVPDGVSLLLAARVFRRRFRQRVAGVDLFESLCEGCAVANLRVFFLGGRPHSAALAATRLSERYPGLNVVTYCPPLGFENDPTEMNHIANRICGAKPHILFVAFGAPKQEYWIYEHGRKLGANVCVGVGGSFEMVSGLVRRAPQWVQALSCEWLYRLCIEPRRLWRRYLIGNPQFLSVVLSQFITRAIFDVLLHLLKSSKFDSELLDSKSLAEAIELMLRFTTQSKEQHPIE